MMEKIRKLIYIEGSHTMKISCDFLLLDYIIEVLIDEEGQNFICILFHLL